MCYEIFINYRRGSAATYAWVIFWALHYKLGPNKAFLDQHSIEAGAAYPDVIRAALKTAKTVVVVIDPDWLRISDGFGRRRIDDRDDWVLQEIIAALESEALVIPTLVDGARPPPDGALPQEIRSLGQLQAIELRNDSWNEDVENLIKVSKISASPIEAAKSEEIILPGNAMEVILDMLSSIQAALESNQSRFKKNGRQLYEDYIEPVFTCMEKVHTDYTRAFSELIESSKDQELPPYEAVSFLRARSIGYKPIRSKVRAQITTLETIDCDEDIKEDLIKFSNACEYYFLRSQSPGPRHDSIGGSSPSYFSMFIQLFEESAQRKENPWNPSVYKKIIGGEPTKTIVEYLETTANKSLPERWESICWNHEILKRSLLK